MDLWWPPHEIFTGNYADTRAGGGLVDVGADFTPAFHGLQPLQSPFASADRSDPFPP